MILILIQEGVIESVIDDIKSRPSLLREHVKFKKEKNMSDEKDEAPVVKRVMMKASQLGLRLLRNNRGMFKTIDGKRMVRAGLEAEGASDLVGIHTVKITPEMVGKKVGIFLAVEVKKPSWERPTTETERQQQNFIDQVNKRGGIAFFINNHEKLEEEIKNFFKPIDNVDLQNKEAVNVIHNLITRVEPDGKFLMDKLSSGGQSKYLIEELNKYGFIKNNV